MIERIPQILGVGVGLVLGLFAMLYLLVSMGIYLNEPGVPHRQANCVLASVPFLFTVGIVFASFTMGDTSWGRALLYTILAELGLWGTIALLALCWVVAVGA